MTKLPSKLIIPIVLLAFLINACGRFLPPEVTDIHFSESSSETKQTLTPIIFKVDVRGTISDSESIVLGILDPISGISMNPVFYPMVNISPSKFKVLVDLPKDSLVYYKYFIQGNGQHEEVTSLGEPISSRILITRDQNEVVDILAKWEGDIKPIRYGQIKGTISDFTTSEGIPDLIINVAGIEKITNGMGQFEINGLLEGENLITVRSFDGSYPIYQQSAIIKNGMVTEANIGLKKPEVVEVTFLVELTKNTEFSQPIRIVGDLQQFGNTFSNIGGGLTIDPRSSPTLIPQEGGGMVFTIPLPIGTILNYKYTSGDGFWNVEKMEGGNFRIRQMIVPATDIQVKDQIVGWSSEGSNKSITIRVKVPASTPQNEIVTIQLNPYDWTPPLPMTEEGENIWRIELFQPSPLFSTSTFRFCRNYNCEKGVESTPDDPQSRTLDFTSNLRNYDFSIGAWRDYSGILNAQSMENVVTAKNHQFITGIDLGETEGRFGIANGIEMAGYIQANTVVIPYSYSFRLDNPTMIQPAGFAEASTTSIFTNIEYAKSLGKNVLLQTKLIDTGSTDEKWRNIEITSDFSGHLLDQYQDHLLSAGILAGRTKASGLIIDARDLWPIVPYFGEPDQPELSSAWGKIITSVRQVYEGPIFFMVNYSNEGLRGLPTFAEDFDGFYIDWTAGLALDENTSQDEMKLNAYYMLQNDIIPSIPSGRSILIGLNAPSTIGVKLGCSQNEAINCVVVESPGGYQTDPIVDLDGQAMVYRAMLMAIDQRSDIEGFVSRGFDSSVLSADDSSSVYGKPSFDLLWYWYPRWVENE